MIWKEAAIISFYGFYVFSKKKRNILEKSLWKTKKWYIFALHFG